jgi:hypothetical protein
VLTEDLTNTPIISSSSDAFMRQWQGGLRENNVKTHLPAEKKVAKH